jgi:ornithine carbamoyltransferase
MAVVQLGGHPITVRGEEVGIDVRESAEDVARTLACYHAVICARVFEHHKLERMAAAGGVPVVNLLSDASHPLQAIADLLTLRQCAGVPLAGIEVAWVGDWTNVARSLAHGLRLSGGTIRWAGPRGYGPSDQDIRDLGGVTCSDDPLQIVDGAHAVVTDTWYSMGQEVEAAIRRKAFKGYTVDASLMSRARNGAIFLHCLPAHRGEEVTDEVLDGPSSRVWPEAANRLHAARAVLAFLCGGGG